MRIVGLSGSLRKDSFNTALLRAATVAMPDGAELEIASIAGIPLYNGDLEEEHGLPDPVVTLKALIGKSDGLLLVTPEYNNSIPGVFKNALDWASRPASDIPALFGDKPVALMGASPGMFGTILSQDAWLPVLRTLGADLWTSGRLLLPRAHEAFAPDGALLDAKMQDRLAAFMAAFVAHVGATRREEHA